MNADQLIVFALIAGALLLMASNRFRYDFIAMAVVLALMFSGVLTVDEALAGFGNPVVLLIAALLVIGEMLERTGVARLVGDRIMKHGAGREGRLLVLIMISSALLSAVMSSTAVVAIFIPILLRVSAQTSISASRLLLPMSYAALTSGMLTLIATPPNLVISGGLAAAGYEPLGFFSFSVLGLLVLAFIVVYIILLGRHGLPAKADSSALDAYERPLDALWSDYHVDRTPHTLRIKARSSLCGKRLGDAGLHRDYGLRVLHVLRPGFPKALHIAAPDANVTLQAGDTLLLMASPALIARVTNERDLLETTLPAAQQREIYWEVGALSVLIHPNSRLIGRSIRDARFRSTYGLDVYGVRRNQEPMVDYEDVRLEASDSLLVTGPWQRLGALRQQNHDFVVLEAPLDSRDVVPAHGKMSVALALTMAMVVASLFDGVPLVAAALVAATAGVVTRCLSAEDAYRSIHWSSLVLLAGMLPLATALEKTGGTDLIVATLMDWVGDGGPQAMLTLLFLTTVLLTNVLSNTTAAILMAPIAIGASEAFAVSPYPLSITLLLAASCAFLTPVASPVVTLVVEPGKYRFTDFLKLGVAPVLVVYLVAFFIAPLVFPW